MPHQMICGVEVAIRRCGRSITVDVGGETFTPREIDALSPSPDWGRDVQVGPFTFDGGSAAILRRFVRSKGAWTPPATGLAVPPSRAP